MMSSSNHSPDQPSNNSIPKAKSFQWSEIDLQETFELIDSLLSAKACLHFQIIPLRLRDNCLVLGIVNSQDISVLNYVRSLIANHSYSLEVRQLDAKNHQLLISAYFNHQRTTKQTELVTQTQGEETFFDLASQTEDLPNLPSAETDFNHYPTLDEISVTSPLSRRNYLEIETHNLGFSNESLDQISSQKLWRELLHRILQSNGIGRLYFECHPKHGRIVWSQDGTIQLSLDQLQPQFFQEVITEVKKLSHLPLQPLKQMKKVELEQYYRQERVLVRVELKPGQHGEEGTLQILRGKALIFYQQQQMDELGEQAIHLAKQLERKLRQIQARTQINPYPFKALATLQDIETNIKRQLDLLQS
jgi:type II secretory ATPase GspE/PulE/Tfp pilus assembly ATPase PilB-like protein